MTTSFVGRRRELSELAGQAAQARAGQGSAVLVTGEPGAGKSTLLERATAAAVGPVLAGRAVPDDGAPAFWPWLRLLDQPAAAALGLAPGLLSLQPDNAPSARFLAVERTVRGLVSAAEQDGLTLLLDDLQWADDASLQLLRYLCGELASSRILLLGTCRDPDGAAGTPALLTEVSGLAAVRLLRLPPLAEQDTARYLGTVAGPEVDAAWARQVHRLSGGNALYVRELVRLLVQEGRLAGPAGALSVPAELRRLVGYRLGRLGEQCHRLLGGCAAIGDEFSLGLLAAAGADVAPLAEAVAAGVLLENPDAPQQLRFSHGLVRQAAYESLGREERVEWHRRIADALPATPDHAAERARHAVRAAIDPASSRSALAACRGAAATAAAPEDAARWLRHAVDLLTPAGADDTERAETLLALAEAAYQDGQVTEAVALCQQAADLAERLHRPDLGALAAVTVRAVSGPASELAALCERARRHLDDSSALSARLLAQHAWVHAELANPELAQQLSARALAIAERTGDREAMFAALDARHHAVDSVDFLDEHLELGERQLALATAENRPDAALFAHLWRLDAGYQLGDMAVVDAELRALDALADRLQWPLARWHVLRARASRALLAGDFAGAESTALQARDISARTQDFVAHGLFYAFITSLLLRTGRFEAYPETANFAEAATTIPIGQATFGLYVLNTGDRDAAMLLYNQLVPSLPTLPKESRWLPTLVIGAELAVRLGDTATAGACYHRMLPYGHVFMNATTAIGGSVARILGVVATALGQYDTAVEHLDRAVAGERRIGALPDAVLAELALARALLARGGPDDRDRARQLATGALASARRLGMAPARAEAAALLDELAGVRADAVLTAREREIAALVATGLANRAIAESLVVSERTVETHVRNVLSKLGLTNRTQVAAWAARAGITT